jgi:REP element-mobilizing transposase RayT
MLNHVYLLITPQVEVPKLLRSLKGITAKRANQILGLTGRAFWQEFDQRSSAYLEGAGRGAGCGPGGPPHSSKTNM